MRSIAILLVASAAFLTGQTSFRAPRLGAVRDRSGALRQMLGVAGSFVPGESLAEDVQAAAWCGEAGILTTAQGLRWLTNGELKPVETETQPTRLLCAGAAPAIVREDRVEVWTGEDFEAWPVRILGEILSVEGNTVLASDAGGLRVLELSIDHRRVLASHFLGVEAPRAALLGGGVLYQDGEELVLVPEGSDAQRASIGSAGAQLQFEPMGPGWIHAFDFERGVNLAARVRDGRLQIFALPEVTQ